MQHTGDSGRDEFVWLGSSWQGMHHWWMPTCPETPGTFCTEHPCLVPCLRVPDRKDHDPTGNALRQRSTNSLPALTPHPALGAVPFNSSKLTEGTVIFTGDCP